MEIILKQRTDDFLEKFIESDAKVAAVQKMKNDEFRAKRHIEIIKRMDKEENVMRIAKIQEYQREKTLKKIIEDNERAEKIRYII